MKLEMETLGKLVRDEADAKGIPNVNALRVFHDAYKEHKQQYGSFKNHSNYTEVMNQRYDFMYQKAMDYIHEQFCLRTTQPIDIYR